MSLNHRDITVLMDGIAPVLRSYVEKAFEPIGARLKDLENRLGALEDAIPKYKGVWQSGDLHSKGDMVTFKGCVWHCNELTTHQPGDGHASWTLAVKAGRDAR